MAVWWERASADEREQISDLPTVAHRRPAASRSPATRYAPRVRDVLLEALFALGSNLLLLPLQDVFGWRDRINEPATSRTIDNWTFRLPWPTDRLDEIPPAQEGQARRSRARDTVPTALAARLAPGWASRYARDP